MELRRYPRKTVFLHGILLKDAFTEDYVIGDGRVFNLSIHGCKLFGDPDIKAGQQVGLLLFLPSEDIPLRVRINLAVVRWVEDGEVGLDFVAMEKEAQAHIQGYLDSCPERVSQQPSGGPNGPAKVSA